MSHEHVTHEGDLSKLDKKTLIRRIQELEQRVARAEPLPVATETAELGLLNNAWLIAFGQYLLTESDKNIINNALHRLGSMFNAVDCSLWQIKSIQHAREQGESAGWHRLGAWQPEENDFLGTTAWMSFLSEPKSPAYQQLNAGEPLVLLANTADFTPITQPLSEQGVKSSLLVPVLRYNLLEGFVVIHRPDHYANYVRDVDRLKIIVQALFSLYERQQLVQKLRIRDTRFNYAIEASSDGIWDWNINNGRIYFSRSYLRMLGYHYEDLPGNLTALKDYFLHGDDVARVMGHYNNAIERGECQVNLQYRMQHQNGSVIWVQSRAKFCEPDAQGRATRCVGLNNNITDFITAREDLLAAKIQADAASKTKTEFLARMSHEIRTPMNAIIGLGYLLKDTSLDEKQKSYLSSLNAAADSLLHIINEVLDFSKIDTGKIILDQTHFDLDHMFEKISRLFENSAIHKAIRIVYDIKSDVPRFLRGDAARLSQVLGHLINNSLRYSSTNEVIVAVKLQEATIKHVRLEFSVVDFGIGISPERMTQLNDVLANNNPLEDNNRSRFGLGICSHLIHLMNGDMRIDSKPGQGCAVTFQVQFDNSHLGSRLLHKNTWCLKNIRALIVDDNLVARTVMATTAKSLGLNVDDAETAEACFEKINQANAEGNPFHFVLMDYRMPTMDGLEAAAKIKACDYLSFMPHIILVSAYHRDEIAGADHIALYVDEFLSKPVSESRLLESINSVIGKDQGLQDISALSSELSEQDAFLKTLHVLVAEDNLVNQQVVRGVLKKKNIRVTIANNGLEAVNAINAASEPFDIVLMDLEMPEMDGIEATHEIRTNSCAPHIPIVALTAQAMRGDRERCLDAGMDAYLSKPINPELLYRTLADQLNPQLASKNA